MNVLTSLHHHISTSSACAAQLLELRAVVARLLGLDVSALPVPDVEILNRIERLVRTHDENSLATFTADRDLEHVSREFRAGAPHCKFICTVLAQNVGDRLGFARMLASRHLHLSSTDSLCSLSLPQATTRRADCSDADARRSAAARPARSHTTTTSAAAVLHQSTARRRDSRRRSTRAATNPAIIHNEQRAVSQLSHLLNNRLIQSLSSISVKYSNKEDFTVLTAATIKLKRHC